MRGLTFLRIYLVLILLKMLIPDKCTGQTASEDLDEFVVIIMQIIDVNTDNLSRQDAIPKIDSEVLLDGNLTGEVWKQAAVWQLPWEISRGENRLANDETYVMMMTDDDNIHLLFVNLDSNPERIRGTLTDRNAWLWDNNDAAGLMLDTYNDGRNAYIMAVNSAGVQYDAMRLDRGAQGTEQDESFNFLWESSVHHFDKGYLVEISIPFSQLQIKAVGEVIQMGFLPFRFQPREFRYHFSDIEWDFNRNCDICQFSTIDVQNPELAPSSHQIQWIPYASGFTEGKGSGKNLLNHSAEFSGSAGLDVKYQRYSSVIDATIFPDFSQVETDAFQMTSNVQFLPLLMERRPFFMERADLFRLPIDETVYSRSIVDPIGGVRWTGKTNQHNWAIISMPDQTGWFIDPGPQKSRFIADERVNSWSNIFRYRYDLSSDVLMGALYSDRTTEDGYNRLASYDGQFSISSNHTLDAQVIGSWNRYPEFFSETYGVSSENTVDYGYLLRFRRAGSEEGGVGHDYRIETRRFGDDLITGTGVLQRTGIHHLLLVGAYNHWMDHDYIVRIRPWMRAEGYWQLNDGKLLTRRNQLGMHVFGLNRTYIRMQFDYTTEFVDRSNEEISRVGEFDMFSGRIRLETSITPDILSSIDFRRGEAVDFTLVEKMDQYEVSLENEVFLLNRQMEISHILEYMKLFEDETVQDALTQSLRVGYQITKRFAIRNILQYRDFRFPDPRYPDSLSSRVRTFQSQLLFRYRMNHATALHLGGFTEFGEELPDEIRIGVLGHSQWQLFLKIAYLL